MKRLLMISIAALALTLTISGCAELLDRDDHPYDNPFYAKYLDGGSPLDAQIQRTLEALRQNPGSPRLHNDLGTLLVQKGFPKDAEREFERAVNADRHFYPGWYNLGLVRASRGEEFGARHAFNRTIAYKPGHAAALALGWHQLVGHLGQRQFSTGILESDFPRGHGAEVDVVLGRQEGLADARRQRRATADDPEKGAGVDEELHRLFFWRRETVYFGRSSATRDGTGVVLGNTGPDSNASRNSSGIGSKNESGTSN